MQNNNLKKTKFVYKNRTTKNLNRITNWRSQSCVALMWIKSDKMTPLMSRQALFLVNKFLFHFFYNKFLFPITTTNSFVYFVHLIMVFFFEYLLETFTSSFIGDHSSLPNQKEWVIAHMKWFFLNKKTTNQHRQ